MSELLTLSEDLKSEIKLDSDGKGYVSIRGAARLFGVVCSSLIEAFGDRLESSKLGQKLTGQGFDVIGFSVNGVPDLALPVIADYYAFESKQASDEVKTNCLNFIRLTSSIGVRVWMQKLKGYQAPNMSEDLLLKVLSKLENLEQKQNEQQLMLESSNREKEDLKDQVDELIEFKDEVNYYEQFVQMLEIARDQVNGDEYLDGVYCRQYVILNNIPLDESAWCTLSRRAASFYRLTKGRNPERRGCHNIYRGKDVAYIIATIRLIIQGL